MVRSSAAMYTRYLSGDKGAGQGTGLRPGPGLKTRAGTGAGAGSRLRLGVGLQSTTERFGLLANDVEDNQEKEDEDEDEEEEEEEEGRESADAFYPSELSIHRTFPPQKRAVMKRNALLRHHIIGGNNRRRLEVVASSVSSISMTRLGGNHHPVGGYYGVEKSAVTAASAAAAMGRQKGVGGGILKHKNKGQGQVQGQDQRLGQGQVPSYDYGHTGRLGLLYGLKTDVSHSSVSWGGDVSVDVLCEDDEEREERSDERSEEKSCELFIQDDDGDDDERRRMMVLRQREVGGRGEEDGEDEDGDDMSVATSGAAMAMALNGFRNNNHNNHNNHINNHNNSGNNNNNNDHNHHHNDATTTATHPPPVWSTYRSTVNPSHHDHHGDWPSPSHDAFRADNEINDVVSDNDNDDDAKGDSQVTPLRLVRHIYPPQQPQRSDISEISCSKAGGQGQGPSAIHHSHPHPHSHRSFPHAMAMESKLLFEACDLGQLDVVQLLLTRAKDRDRAGARKKGLLTKARARDKAKAFAKAVTKAITMMKQKEGEEERKGMARCNDGTKNKESRSPELMQYLAGPELALALALKQNGEQGKGEEEGKGEDEENDADEEDKSSAGAGTRVSPLQDLPMWLEEKDGNGETALMRAIRYVQASNTLCPCINHITSHYITYIIHNFKPLALTTQPTLFSRINVSSFSPSNLIFLSLHPHHHYYLPLTFSLLPTYQHILTTCAIRWNRVGVVRMLLDGGANIETTTDQGCTALMIAASCNRYVCVFCV